MTPDGRIRLLIVDGHTLFRRGLAALLQTDARFAVVGEAADGAQALAAAAATPADVVLLNPQLPDIRGADLVAPLRQAAHGLRVLMLAASDDLADLAASLRAGASGYLMRTADDGELAAAVLAAMRGASTIGAPMAARLAEALGAGSPPARPPIPPAPPPESVLSPRERDTLALLADGGTNKAIARRLGIGESTVKFHVENLLRKLGLASRVQAAAWWATRRGG